MAWPYEISKEIINFYKREFLYKGRASQFDIADCQSVLEKYDFEDVTKEIFREQPSRLVNCCACGISGERGDFYQDKVNDRYACVDLTDCIARQIDERKHPK